MSTIVMTLLCSVTSAGAPMPDGARSRVLARAAPVAHRAALSRAGAVMSAQTSPSRGSPPQGSPGQVAPGPGSSVPQVAQPQPAAPAIPVNEPYTYSPEGRRDPFLNLLGTGAEPRSTGSRKTDGPATMAVADISVRGIMQSRGALVAMVQGPDNKTYIVHQGDRFLDGTIKSITPQSLVILQEINDPLSTAKQREVRKLLRTLEDVKE